MDTDELLEALRRICAECPPGYIRILRMAVDHDPHTRPHRHGPGWGNMPDPSQDSPRHFIKRHERCAALVDQFRAWWPKPGRYVEYDHEYEFDYPRGQVIYVLELPADKPLIQRRQVIYEPQYARIVAQFQPH